MASMNYNVIDITVIIILTSSRPKSNICLHYFQCTHTNASPSDVIQGIQSQGRVSVCIVRLLVNVTDF
jgi:hypothetical protein